MKMLPNFYKISVTLAIITQIHGYSGVSKTDLARCTQFRTFTNEYDYKFPITTTHINEKKIFLEFYIKSDRDASIKIFSIHDPDTYEIILSANKTRPSEIRSTEREIVAKNFEENILSSNEWHPFWIRLSQHGSIEVGKEIGSSAFLSWKNEKKREPAVGKELGNSIFFSLGNKKRHMPINHIGFASYDNAVVNWAFRCSENKTFDIANCIYLKTTEYDYKAAFPIVDGDTKDFYFKFYVKATKEAHVVLSPTPKPALKGERAYEIVLGGWENSGAGIRTVRGDLKEISYTEYYMLSPDEWRPFWIRISPDGLIQVGKKEGSPAFMSWKDRKAEIPEASYSVASHTNGTVDWALECSKKQFREEYVSVT